MDSAAGDHTGSPVQAESILLKALTGAVLNRTLSDLPKLFCYHLGFSCRQIPNESGSYS
jgi:hypothetical protein